MNLRSYLERDGARLNRSHPELARLARQMKMSAYTLYLVALGHKQLGLRKAIALVDLTDGAVDGTTLCDAFPQALRPVPKADAA